MNICTYSYQEYLHLVKSFHGKLVPGLIIGGFIVDLAIKYLPEGEYFNAICETYVCLPDAVQILTPCTIGNGWLSIVPFDKFAITLYEKGTGKGVRVYMDTKKIGNWPVVRDWYMKKNEQKQESLLSIIKEAGHGLLGIQNVQVEPEKFKRKKMSPVVVCPICSEVYPMRHGDKCLNCQGNSPYDCIDSIKTFKQKMLVSKHDKAAFKTGVDLECY